jgi:hypothetical protein
VYKESLQSWRKYELHLQPLVEKIGERVKFDLRTTLPSYRYTDTHDTEPEPSSSDEL